MIGRTVTAVLAGLVLARPALGQRLADVAPIYIARPYFPSERYGQCSVVTRGAWAVAGAIVGTMGGMVVLGLTTWDRGPSPGRSREVALVLSAGALVGGVYGWFKLADQYACD